MPRWLKRTLLALGFLVVLLGALVYAYAQPLPAKTVALEAMRGDTSVRVSSTGSAIVFTPNAPTTRGFVFYQGARVAPEAYAPALLRIAQAGYIIFVPRMPLNFAVLGVGAAKGIMDANPDIRSWAIGGHSLGGAMACSYAVGDARIQMLVFWAAYCDRSFDLSSNAQIRVTSIAAARDGLATADKIERAKQYAPATTRYVVIQGMNHAQFGDYGNQDGDNPATLDNAAATDAVVRATLEALSQLK
jgi:pimeloyl-ACP methyl ester carboxylesterase